MAYATFILGYFATSLLLVTAQKYPITASWFEDRFSRDEWNGTLSNFTRIGGDTVLLKASFFNLQTEAEIKADPDFASCGNLSNGTSCLEEAKKDMADLGFKIASFATYKYEENFSDVIMVCPKYEKKIVGSKTYFRLVLSLKAGVPCSLPKGSQVIVLFTVFSGVDPHDLLLQNAVEKNLSVFFGLPEAPKNPNGTLNEAVKLAYFEWTSRVLTEHKIRYMAKVVTSTKSKYKTFYDAIVGYTSAETLSLGEVSSASGYIDFYNEQSYTVYQFGKKLLISANIDIRRIGGYSLDEHVKGFQVLSKSADILNIYEGRGFGHACYYWPTQENLPIANVDEELAAILYNQNPNLKPNTTFDDFFVGSVQQVFQLLYDARTNMTQNGSSFDLWLNIEAFEFLQDDPCSSVGKPSSGFTEAVDRTTKGRLDRALSAAASFVQKVSVFSWDPFFTCVTRNFSKSLSDQVNSDAGRPIIAHCSFHSEFNRSVVVIGFNLLGETQGFTVEWFDIGHSRHTSSVHGYYFESDYGGEHHLVPSLIYTQLYDPYNVIQLNPKGHVKVTAGGSTHSCIFTYDYT